MKLGFRLGWFPVKLFSVKVGFCQGSFLPRLVSIKVGFCYSDFVEVGFVRNGFSQG